MWFGHFLTLYLGDCASLDRKIRLVRRVVATYSDGWSGFVYLNSLWMPPQRLRSLPLGFRLRDPDGLRLVPHFLGAVTDLDTLY